MHLAAERNMVQVLDESLIGNGGDVTIKNKAGFTCLHIAAKEGYTDMCKMLLARGCLPDIRDQFGFTAAYWAH
jgi:ankyrin repeat protein